MGNDHFDQPFVIGDIDPSGGFVHVFDEVALDVLLDELDTISDFTNYLEKRAKFVRSGHLAQAHGEEDLFAYYAIRTNDAGDHDFVPPNGKSWEENSVLDGSHWQGMREDPQYRAKKDADRISYVWDRLIGVFSGHLLGGTSIVLPGFSYDLKSSEQALRFMALEDRVSRRSHARAIVDALEMGTTRDVFFRAMLSTTKDKPSDTGFFILTLKYPAFLDDHGGYEQYRLVRTKYLETYAISMLRKHPELKRMIGIAMEPPNQGRGMSEDNIYVEQQDWDEKTIAEIEEAAKVLGIMQTLKRRDYHEDEFPEAAAANPRPNRHLGGNRKERRAAAARNRRGH